jgi:hypothetical protein
MRSTFISLVILSIYDTAARAAAAPAPPRARAAARARPGAWRPYPGAPSLCGAARRCSTHAVCSSSSAREVRCASSHCADPPYSYDTRQRGALAARPRVLA